MKQSYDNIIYNLKNCELKQSSYLKMKTMANNQKSHNGQNYVVRLMAACLQQRLCRLHAVSDNLEPIQSRSLKNTEVEKYPPIVPLVWHINDSYPGSYRSTYYTKSKNLVIKNSVLINFDIYQVLLHIKFVINQLAVFKFCYV